MQPGSLQACLHSKPVQFGGHTWEQLVVTPSQVTEPRTQDSVEQLRLIALQVAPVHEMSGSASQSSLQMAFAIPPGLFGLFGLLAVEASATVAEAGSTGAANSQARSSPAAGAAGAGAGADSQERSSPVLQGDWAAADSAPRRRRVVQRAIT